MLTCRKADQEVGDDGQFVLPQHGSASLNGNAGDAGNPDGYDLEAQMPLRGREAGTNRTTQSHQHGGSNGISTGSGSSRSGAVLPCGCPAPDESDNDNQPAGHEHDITRHMGGDIVPRFTPLLHIAAVGPLKCNMVIIGDPQTREAVLVDPGGEEDVIIAAIEQLQVKITKILITHAHFDHLLAAGLIRSYTGAPVYLHPSDRILWDFLPMQLKLMGKTITTELFESIGKPDQSLADGQELGVLDGKCIHTPGHTQGSCCFYFEQSRILLAGDTLFNGSVGRTDLLGGDPEKLRHSIQTKLYSLPDAVTVIPGHGKRTTIGKEKNSNAIIRATSPSVL